MLCGLLLAAAAAKPDLPWVDAMRADGYVVREGIYGFFTMEVCAHTDTCYGINPLSPYGWFLLPPHPNETSTAANYTNSCHKHGFCRQVGNESWGPNWRVAPGETLVAVGRTPPDSTYWSLAAYLYTRYNKPGFIPRPARPDQFISICPPVPRTAKEGIRCEEFAGINDPVNMQTVNASAPFNSSFSMVFSWDAESETATQGYLQAQGGVPNSEMNVLRFPGAISNLGASRGDEDEFMVLQRLAGVKDPKALADFLADPPVRVFRITPPSGRPAPVGFASFDGRMRERWTGKNESGEGVSNQQLRDGLAELEKVIVSRHSASEDDHVVLDLLPFVNDSGYECVATGLQCRGDCRDTVYGKNSLLALCNITHKNPCPPAYNATLSEDPKDLLYVIGVDHERTNQAIYNSITMYNLPRLAAGLLRPKGAGGQYSLDAMLKDTAQGYLPGNPAAKYLYAVKFARHCAPDDTEFCVEVPTNSSNPNDIPMSLQDPLAIVERAYIHPGTHSGPAIAETVLGRMMHFRPAE